MHVFTHKFLTLFLRDEIIILILISISTLYKRTQTHRKLWYVPKVAIAHESQKPDLNKGISLHTMHSGASLFPSILHFLTYRMRLIIYISFSWELNKTMYRKSLMLSCHLVDGKQMLVLTLSFIKKRMQSVILHLSSFCHDIPTLFHLFFIPHRYKKCVMLFLLWIFSLLCSLIIKSPSCHPIAFI